MMNGEPPAKRRSGFRQKALRAVANKHSGPEAGQFNLLKECGGLPARRYDGSSVVELRFDPTVSKRTVNMHRIRPDFVTKNSIAQHQVSVLFKYLDGSCRNRQVNLEFQSAL